MHTSVWWMGPLLLVLLAPACGDGTTGITPPWQGTLQIGTSIFAGRATVIDSVHVSVESAAGATRAFGTRLVGPDPVTAIAVRATEGTHVFRARVYSNDGSTVLYTGSTTAEVRGDGFQVGVDLEPVAAVFAVRPDTLRLGRDGPLYLHGELHAENLGTDAATFRVDPDRLPFAECPAGEFSSCIGVQPGSAAVGSTAVRLFVELRLLTAQQVPTEPFPLHFLSSVGEVTVVLDPRP